MPLLILLNMTGCAAGRPTTKRSKSYVAQVRRVLRQNLRRMGWGHVVVVRGVGIESLRGTYRGAVVEGVEPAEETVHDDADRPDCDGETTQA